MTTSTVPPSSLRLFTMSAIQYRFGRTADGAVVDIHQLDESARVQSFLCIGCGGRLVPHLKDDLRARHFAHHRPSLACSARETYLHLAAKALFAQTYRHCLETQQPFKLTIPVTNTCDALRDQLGFTCAFECRRDHDLTQWYDVLQEEAGVGPVRADILLTSRTQSERRPLLVEFAVTHECEPAKIGTGERILEISIRGESDLVHLLTAQIVVAAESQAKVHNFKPRPETGPFCEMQCPRPVGVAVVHASGKAKLFPVTAAKAHTFTPKTAVWRRVLTQFEPAPVWVGIDQLEYRGTDLPNGGSLLERTALAAMLDGAPIVNCYTCRHRGSAHLFSEVWCHEHREQVHNNHAVSCQYYKRMSGPRELRQLEARIARWRRHS